MAAPTVVEELPLEVAEPSPLAVASVLAELWMVSMPPLDRLSEEMPTGRTSPAREVVSAMFTATAAATETWPSEEEALGLDWSPEVSAPPPRLPVPSEFA